MGKKNNTCKMAGEELPTVPSEDEAIECLTKKVEFPFIRTCPTPDGKDECKKCVGELIDKVTDAFGGSTYHECEGSWIDRKTGEIYTTLVKKTCVFRLNIPVPPERRYTKFGKKLGSVA